MATEFPQQPKAKPIHFFKIITDHNLHQGKLMIPNKFVEKYGEGLPNTLFLKTPNGAEWKLNLEKCDGKIWFQKGWKEFAEYHSLAHGHLLVFGRERTSHFQVHICDLSGLEIDYPSITIEGRTASNNQGNKSSNNENLEFPRPNQKRKHNPSLECLQPHQMRSHKRDKKNNLVLPEETVHHTDTKCKEKSKTIANQVTALDRASSFKPINPFFLIVLHPSYLHRLYLPAVFCRTHFDLHNKQRLINLQVLNGRVWPTKFLISKSKTKTLFRLSSGWKAFVKHNHFRVGDVCTFELIHTTKLTFQVHIFREIESSNCSTSQESGQMRSAC